MQKLGAEGEGLRKQLEDWMRSLKGKVMWSLVFQQCWYMCGGQIECTANIKFSRHS